MFLDRVLRTPKNFLVIVYSKFLLNLLLENKLLTSIIISIFDKDSC